jgi:hypothetical protein
MYDFKVKRSKLGLKGQFSVEFFSVLVLFVIISAYFSIRLAEVRPAYIKEVKRSVIRSEAYRISEVLINDPGSPMNWGAGGSVIRIGFLDNSQNKTNLLSEQKILRFNSLCNGGAGYNNIKNLIGAQHDFSIIINDKTGSIGTIDCSAKVGESAAVIKRLVTFDSGNYGELIVQVW